MLQDVDILVNSEKQKNIAEMLEAMTASYENNKNVEIALIFEEKPPYSRIGFYYSPKPYDIKRSENDHAFSLDISESLNSFEVNRKEGCHACAFHNHRHASCWGFSDIASLLDYEFNAEAFLDSSVYIYYAIKTIYNGFSEEACQQLLKYISKVRSDISKAHKKEYDLIVQEYRDAMRNNDAEKINMINRKFEDVSFNINRDIFDTIKRSNQTVIRFTRIEKISLSQN